MTVAAIDAVVADVVLVAKLHGLLAGLILVRQIRRARGSQNHRQPQSDQKQRRKDTESGEEVCAAVKDLRHFKCLHFGGERSGREQKAVRPPSPNRMCKPDLYLTR